MKTLEQRIQRLVLAVIIDYQKPRKVTDRVELANLIAARIIHAFYEVFS